MRIQEILNQIDIGSYALPEFQRGYVWNRDQVKKLIMSLYKNDTLEYVKLAVESILNQTYRQFDFYIQYDGYIPQDVDGYLSEIKDKFEPRNFLVPAREQCKKLVKEKLSNVFQSSGKVINI